MEATQSGEWPKINNHKIKTGYVAAILVIALLTAFPASAQYRTALGARLGGTSGFTIKQTIWKPIRGELIAGTFENGFSITALLESQTSLAGSKSFFLYYGAGPHVAFYNGEDVLSSNFGRNVKYESDNDVAIGINLVAGVEYKIPRVPFVLSADIKPFMEFGTGGFVVFAPDPSVGLKFIIP